LSELDEDQLNRTFAALADPKRRAILAELAGGERTVNELARPYSMSLQAVSKHLKVLEEAGLISRGRQAQWRPARLEVAPLATATEWIERYRDVARERVDRHGRRRARDLRAPGRGRRGPAQPRLSRPFALTRR
jgi:DNA-binding transcriptional ArsR family regulator